MIPRLVLEAYLTAWPKHPPRKVWTLITILHPVVGLLACPHPQYLGHPDQREVHSGRDPASSMLRGGAKRKSVHRRLGRSLPLARLRTGIHQRPLQFPAPAGPGHASSKVIISPLPSPTVTQCRKSKRWSSGIPGIHVRLLPILYLLGHFISFQPAPSDHSVVFDWERSCSSDLRA